ncbi:TPA: sigma factor-like helix-turn-helix DNA-binding protein [Escherichia coli]
MTKSDRIYIEALSQLFPELSPREREITLFSSVLGLTTDEIARRNGVKRASVDTYFDRAKVKLNCCTLQELRGIIQLRILAHCFLK